MTNLQSALLLASSIIFSIESTRMLFASSFFANKISTLQSTYIPNLLISNYLGLSGVPIATIQKVCQVLAIHSILEAYVAAIIFTLLTNAYF